MEGIQWKAVQYSDNRDCLELLQVTLGALAAPSCLSLYGGPCVVRQRRSQTLTRATEFLKILTLSKALRRSWIDRASCDPVLSAFSSGWDEGAFLLTRRDLPHA